jgi:lambda repressor-like predicted transcriptional regulator
MHPELIKAALRIGGVTPAALADSLQVSRMTVSNVIHGRGTSMRIASAIASAIGKSVTDIWPSKYGAANGSSLRRTGSSRRAA